jgi:hypothetical protein
MPAALPAQFQPTPELRAGVDPPDPGGTEKSGGVHRRSLRIFSFVE